MGTFDRLSPHDFEVLCQDIVGARLQITLESFTSGPDGGVDLRHAPSKTAEVIVQCKHYAESGYPALKSKIKSEASKAAALNADRYVLATSVRMTPKRKKDLSHILTSAGAKCSEVDVLGAEDIEQTLREHPEIERRHFKLWLQSSAVLQNVLNNDIFSRTDSYVEELQRQLMLFVQNESVDAALKILDETHTCLISGAPGVGKTTLAQILLLQLIADGYEPIIVSADINEAEKVYQRDVKQLFLYDDFLGRASQYEKLGKNEDDRLLHFMRRVEASPTKRLILTTREYILQEARTQYERLESPSVNLAKYFLSIGIYTHRNRGHILYNHMHFSTLPKLALACIVETRKYRELIDHENYNPRLIENAIAIFNSSEEEPSAFPETILKAFDDPTELWRSVFQHQFSQTARDLLVRVSLANPPTSLDEMEVAHDLLRRINRTDETFISTMSALEGTALSVIKRPWSRTEIDFTNPGVQDAVTDLLLTDSNRIRVAIETSTHFDQLVRLWQLASEPDHSAVDAILHRFTPNLRATSLLFARRSSPSCLRPPLRKKIVALRSELLQRMVSILQEDLEPMPVQFEILLGIAKDLEAETPEILNSTLGKILRTTGSWQRADRKGEVLSLLENAYPHARDSSAEFVSLIQGIAKWFSDSPSTPGDFLHLAALRELVVSRGWPSIELMEPGDMAIEFEQLIEHFCTLAAEASDAQEIQTLLDEIDSCAETLGVDLENLADIDWPSEVDAMHERQGELERDEWEPDDDERRDRGGSDHFTEGNDSEWVDGLFDSLLQ